MGVKPYNSYFHIKLYIYIYKKGTFDSNLNLTLATFKAMTVVFSPLHSQAKLVVCLLWMQPLLGEVRG